MEYLIFDVESTTEANGNPYSKYTSLVLLGFKSSRHGYISMYGDFESIHNVPKATIERMRARWEHI